MFELSADHEEFRALVREFAEAEIEPRVAQWDMDSHFPAELIPKLGELGLFGLVASFHGIILGYSRQFFALARAGYLPKGLAKLNRFHTPHRAIIAGGVIGIAAIYSDGLINLQGMTLTAAMITMAVFGAIVMYIMSMLSLFKLRQSEP
ncbi:MAG TPA: amino acid permease, partial [Dermatophilaceae bacterium]|nr:amino acid permease [Dermatophilaceae bacterium]